MLKNYLKTAVRDLWKNKGFSAINIGGLALGLACSLLIGLWVRDEKSVDAFHAKGDRLYRVVQRLYFDGKVSGQYATPGLLASELKKNIPEVEMASPYEDLGEHTLSVGEKIIKESGGAADSDFFRIFSYPLLAGHQQGALTSPESMTISRTMSVNFFGSPQAALGKTLRFDNRKDFKVTGVFEDLPGHVSEKFDFVVNWTFFLAENDYLKLWDNNDPETNILLYPNARPELVDNKIRHFIDKYVMAEEGKMIPGFRQELSIQPFPDVYLHSHFTDGQIDGGRIEYVRLFSLVAVFILLIACINFMNLTTARSIKRAKEIGVRKVMGAVRGPLIRQFMGEAVVHAFLSACVALLLVLVALPAFNQLTGKQVTLPIGQWSFWLTLIGLVMVTGLLSGSYPALVLSAFNPIQVLKGGTVKAGKGATWFRKGLVVFQFVLSIILINATILVSRQIRYMQDANLGYDRENLLYIPIEGDLPVKADLFREEAIRLPGVAVVSEAGQPPTEIRGWTIGVQWPGKDPNAKPQFAQLATGYDFIKTMKAHIVQGRDFSKDFATDSVAYILNQSAVDKIGYKDAIGQPLTFWGTRGTIIGVANDFHFQSLRDAVKPMILRLQKKERFGVFLIRTQPGQTREALAGLAKLYKDLNPRFPFTYKFSSEEYTKLYNSEELVGRLSVIFAGLAIFISCLGLLGLSIFTAVQRTREIGIRKVLGADMISLFQLLSREFLILVGIAVAIASPVAMWALHKWLEQFAYKTGISWWIFGLSGMIAVLITLGTVCFQTIKVAMINPVKSLRTE